MSNLNAQLGSNVGVSGNITNSISQEQLKKRVRDFATYVVSASDSDSQWGDYLCNGIDDNVQIQSAIDAAASLGDKHFVVLLPGTYYMGSYQNSVILKKKNVTIWGYGAKFLQQDNLDDNIPHVFECESGDHEYTGIYGIEIDGNCDNNTVNINPFPVGGSGVLGAEWARADTSPIYEDEYLTKYVGIANNLIIQDVNIYNTVRDSVVFGGYGHIVRDCIFGKSSQDHQIYISSGQKISFYNIQITEQASTAITIQPTSPGHPAYQQCKDIYFSGLYTNCDFTYNGTVQTVGCTGDLTIPVENLRITGWFIDGTDAQVNSNRHNLYYANYCKNHNIEVSMDVAGHKQQQRFFYCKDSDNIKIKANIDISLSASLESTCTIFSLKDSNHIDLSGSYVNIGDSEVDKFLILSGTCDHINLSDCTFISSNSTIVSENTGDESAGNRTIQMDNFYHTGSSVSDSDDTTFISGNESFNKLLYAKTRNILLKTSAYELVNIPGLNLWFDANTGVTEAGTGVSDWDDRSPNDWDATQGVDANRPALTAAILNGYPVIRFTIGNTDKLAIDPNINTILNKDNDFTIFAVAQIANNADGLYKTILTSSDGTYGVALGTLDGNIGMRVFDGVNWYISTTNTLANGYYIISATYSTTGPTLTIRVNKTEYFETHSMGLLANDGDYIGCGSSGSHIPFDGDIAEILVYNSVLRGDDIVIVENYLNTKYDII